MADSDRPTWADVDLGPIIDAIEERIRNGESPHDMFWEVIDG